MPGSITNISIIKYFPKAHDNNQNGIVEKGEGYEKYADSDTNKDGNITNAEAWQYLESAGLKPDIDYDSLLKDLLLKLKTTEDKIPIALSILSILKNYKHESKDIEHAAIMAINKLHAVKDIKTAEIFFKYAADKNNPEWFRDRIICLLYHIVSDNNENIKIKNLDFELKRNILNDKADNPERRLWAMYHLLEDDFGSRINTKETAKKIISDQQEHNLIRIEALRWYFDQKVKASANNQGDFDPKKFLELSFEFLNKLLLKENKSDMQEFILDKYVDFVSELNNLLVNHNESSRSKLINSMTPESLYITISAGKDEFFTSTFRLCFYAFLRKAAQNGTDISDFIKKIDPDLKLLPNFLMTLGKYECLHPILIKYPSLFDDLKKLLADKNNLITLSSSLNQLLKTENQSISRKTREIVLSTFKGTNDPDVKCILGVLIKLNQNSLSDRLDQADKNYLSNIKSVFNIPSEWFEDGVMRTLMVFHLPEDLSAMRNYFGDRGFTGHVDGKALILQKKYGNKTIEIYCVKSDDLDIIEGLQKKYQFGLFVHRGHNFQRDETFEAIKLPTTYPTIIFDGSCTGYYDKSKLSEKYPDGCFYFMGHKGIGIASVNHRALENLFSFLAKGEAQTIAQLGSKLASKMSDTDLVFPGNQIENLISYNLWLQKRSRTTRQSP